MNKTEKFENVPKIKLRKTSPLKDNRSIRGSMLDMLPKLEVIQEKEYVQEQTQEVESERYGQLRIPNRRSTSVSQSRSRQPSGLFDRASSASLYGSGIGLGRSSNSRSQSPGKRNLQELKAHVQKAQRIRKVARVLSN